MLTFCGKLLPLLHAVFTEHTDVQVQDNVSDNTLYMHSGWHK